MAMTVHLQQTGMSQSAFATQLVEKRSTAGATVWKQNKYKIADNLPVHEAPREISPRGGQTILRLARTQPELPRGTMTWMVMNSNPAALELPLLQPAQVQARLEFAREHLNDPEEDEDNVMWSDETKTNCWVASQEHHPYCEAWGSRFGFGWGQGEEASSFRAALLQREHDHWWMELCMVRLWEKASFHQWEPWGWIVAWPFNDVVRGNGSLLQTPFSPNPWILNLHAALSVFKGSSSRWWAGGKASSYTSH